MLEIDFSYLVYGIYSKQELAAIDSLRQSVDP